jgi:hypothetical protein
MQKAVTVLALATVGLAFDDVTSRFAYQPEVSSRTLYEGERLNAGFDDVSSRLVYQPTYTDPMIIRPNTDIDPKIIIRPRPNVDPKMIIRPTPKPSVMYADDEELNILKSIGKGLGKAASFVASHPQVITTAAKFLDDEELFNVHQAEEEVKKAGKFLAQNPQLIKEAEQKAQQIIHRYSGHKDLVKQDAKEAIEYISQHPELIKEAIQVIKHLKHDDEELFNLGNLIGDGLNIYQDVKSKDYGSLVKHGIQTVKDIKKHDDELNIKENMNSIGNKLQQKFNSVITGGKQLVQNVKTSKTASAADDELSYLNHIMNQGRDSRPKSESTSEKKVVTFDEIEIEDAEYFEDNDLMCVTIRMGGFPYQYCK